MDEHERDERVDELLGAYALDAVDGAERERVEELLRADPRAAQELDEHREVAAALHQCDEHVESLRRKRYLVSISQ